MCATPLNFVRKFHRLQHPVAVCNVELADGVELLTFTVTACNKIFSGYQPCQNGALGQRFRGVLCLHRQGMMVP
jgi:hypothetical protein